jgi:hypothetical protein
MAAASLQRIGTARRPVVLCDAAVVENHPFKIFPLGEAGGATLCCPIPKILLS